MEYIRPSQYNIKLSKAEISELKDLYSEEAGFRGVKEIAKYFNIGETVIMYFVDWKNERAKRVKRAKDWKENNSERAKQISNKAKKRAKKRANQ